MKTKRLKKSVTYTFRKGENLGLDDVYEIQGILPFKWYQQHPDGTGEIGSEELGDEISILKDIEIKISWK